MSVFPVSRFFFSVCVSLLHECKKMFVLWPCPVPTRAARHTGDQSGADHVQLSLRTNAPSGNCLVPTTLSSQQPPHQHPLTPHCVYSTLLAKTHSECFPSAQSQALARAACGDSFLETRRRLTCLWIDDDLFYGFHM